MSSAEFSSSRVRDAIPSGSGRPLRINGNRPYDLVVSEIAGYMLANRGPDESGFAHPNLRRVPLQAVEEALAIARARGLSARWRPHHFRICHGLWQDEAHRDEVLGKKLDLLLKRKFGGKISRLISEVNARTIMSPLVEQIGGRRAVTRMSSLSAQFDRSPYQMVKRYLEIRGHHESAAKLQTFHMGMACLGTFDDPAVGQKLLVRRVGELVEQNKGKKNLIQTLTQMTLDDLRIPLVDHFEDGPVEISLEKPLKQAHYSTYDCARNYLAAIGRRDLYDALQPYHMATTQHGYYRDEAPALHLLELKLDQLRMQRFGGSFARLLTEVQQEDIRAPYQDRLDDTDVPVSMGVPVARLGDCTYDLLKRYLKVKGLTEQYANFRRFHLARVTQGFAEDRTVIGELLERRLDDLRLTYFGGDFEQLVRSVKSGEIWSDFDDDLGGERVTVKMGTCGRSENRSPRRALSIYLRRKDHRELLLLVRRIRARGHSNGREVT